MTAMSVDSPAQGNRGERQSELTLALASVRSRLAGAAEAAGRNVAEIELLPITKFFPATDVAILSRLGCRVGRRIARAGSFGEGDRSRAVVSCVTGYGISGIAVAHGGPDSAQEGPVAGSLGAHRPFDRQPATGDRAGSGGDRCVGRAPTQQTAADLRAGQPGRRRVTRRRRHIHGRGASGGVEKICAEVERSESLELVGLMGIPPLDWEPEQAFDRLQSEHSRVRAAFPNAVGLSAGMSNDLEIAVKHGSTCVRVGTALLGQRRLRSP